MTHPHVLRHTACTRMAEKGMDIKVLQYLMGHSSIDITMQVYNHITDMSRVKNEVVKMDEAVNALKKIKIGVKLVSNSKNDRFSKN